MTKTFQLATILLVSFFCFTGCATTGTTAASESPSVAKKADCNCSEGKAGETVWCDKCSVGYSANKKMKCKGCWQAKADGTECTGCAKKSDAPQAPKATTGETTSEAPAAATATETTPEKDSN